MAISSVSVWVRAGTISPSDLRARRSSIEVPRDAIRRFAAPLLPDWIVGALSSLREQLGRKAHVWRGCIDWRAATHPNPVSRKE